MCQEKTSKGLLGMIKHFIRTLDLISVYLYTYIISIVFVLGQSIYVVFLLNKAEEIFLRFFCKKKKNIRVLIKPTFVGNFEKHLQIQTLILIGYSSPTTLPPIPAFALKSM